MPSGGDRSASPRQRTLRATIEWSYALLTDAEQTLFRRLSVFAGWSLEMAEQVCADDDIPAADVLGLTAALIDKSLVVLEPEVLGQARYRMLDTIRDYAAERRVEAGESARLRLALRDYILRVAENSLITGMAGFPVPWADRVNCSRRYIVDADNVEQILTWCLSQDEAEIGLRICIAVSPRWLVYGNFAEGGEWLDAFLRLEAPAPRVRGAALVARAQLAAPSDPAAAEALAEEGLALCRDTSEDFWTAVALNLTRSIELSQATGTRIGIARGLEVFATLAVQEKQPERAVQLAAAAAALRESAGVPPLPAARTESYLTPARHLGESAVARLWAQGLALSSEAAVALAMEQRPSRAAGDGPARALTVVGEQGDPVPPTWDDWSPGR